ncbi:unnamed protein product [Sympodiomycopsis kandeliae]
MFSQSLQLSLPLLALIACAQALPAPSANAAGVAFLPASVYQIRAESDSHNTVNSSTHDAEHDHSHGHAHQTIVTDFPIHESCNASQALQIRSGFEDMNRLLKSATDHLLLHGNTSDLFKLYFGEDADPAVPLGYYSRILSGDKSKTLFRCDDIDGNCQLPEWNGHWRGNNATGETVICELSYYTRLPLEKACLFGWTLNTGSISAYWGTDLMHRAMHLPSITNEKVGHSADEYSALLALARNDTAQSVANQHTLQTFAFEVWSRENVAPEGCVGSAEASESESAPASTATSSVASAPATTSAASQSSSGECHSHADGSVHCGSH